jgi:hypothetical protein
VFLYTHVCSAPDACDTAVVQHGHVWLVQALFVDLVALLLASLDLSDLFLGVCNLGLPALSLWLSVSCPRSLLFKQPGTFSTQDYTV